MTGNRMKQVRTSLGLSQEEMSQKLGVQRNMLSYYETEKYSIPGEVLEKIVEACNVNADWLLTGRGSEMFGDHHGDSVCEFEVVGHIRLIPKKKKPPPKEPEEK